PRRPAARGERRKSAGATGIEIGRLSVLSAIFSAPAAVHSGRTAGKRHLRSPSSLFYGLETVVRFPRRTSKLSEFLVQIVWSPCGNSYHLSLTLRYPAPRSERLQATRHSPRAFPYARDAPRCPARVRDRPETSATLWACVHASGKCPESAHRRPECARNAPLAVVRRPDRRGSRRKPQLMAVERSHAGARSSRFPATRMV